MSSVRTLLCQLIVVLALAVVPLQSADAAKRGWLGVRAETVTDAMVRDRKLTIPFGVVIEVVHDGGPAIAAGLKIGDVIISVDGVPVRDLATLAAHLKTKVPGDRVSLGLVQSGQVRTIDVVLTDRDAPAGAVQPANAPADITEPELMLETGGHMAVIWMMQFTSDGRQLVTASSDKVIRVWDLEKGRTVRYIRGETGPGPLGKPYAMALSPDDTILAVGGWMHSDCGLKCGGVRFYDFKTGKLLARVDGHSNIIHNLKFSPDGRWLVSGGADSVAIIWDVANRRPVRKLENHRNNIYQALFTPDSRRVVTADYNGEVRIWDAASGNELALLQHNNDPIRAMSLSPDGRTLAAGGRDGTLAIWDIENQRTSGEPIRLASGVGALEFSNDGTRLVVTAGIGRGGYRQRVFDVSSLAQIASYDQHRNTVYSAARHPGGRHVATGDFLGEVHIWEIDTAKSGQVLAGVGQSLWATAFSPDSNSIAWGFQSIYQNNNQRGPLQFVLKLPTADGRLGRPANLEPGLAERFVRAEVSAGPLSVRQIRGGRDGLIEPDGALEFVAGGKVIATHHRGKSDGFRHRSYAVSSDARMVVSGGNNGIILAYDAVGKILGRYHGHNSEVWALSPSPDGRYLVSGSADQTLKIWNLKTRELIASLFHAPDGEWVMWTPQGFFTGSPGAGALVGWQINKGPDEEADYVFGEQFRKTLRRPDIVERALVLTSAEAATAEAFPAGFDLSRLLSSRPPIMEIVTPPQNQTVTGGRTRVTVRVNADETPVDRFEVYVNGRKVKPDQLPVPADHERPPPGWQIFAFDVPLFEGVNDVSLIAANGFGTTPVDANVLRIHHNGEGALDTRGTLHIVAVGVDRYAGLGNTCVAADGATGQPCDLRFAGQDARAFAKTMKDEMGPRHERVVTHLLVTGGEADGGKEPTRANILAAMDLISAANPNDTVVIFLAGHGEQGHDGAYYFLPTDIKRASMAETGSGENIIKWSSIQGAMTTALGRRLLFVDACQSGTANAQRAANDQLLSDARAEKFVAFAATAPEQLAEERPDLGHGLFTYALVEGLKGKALDERERAIRVYGLGGYLSNAVRRMSNGRQTPEFYSGHGDIVLVRK